MLQFTDFHLYSGLCERVVVLDTVQKLRHAPESVSFDHVQHILRNVVDVVRLHVFLCRLKRKKEGTFKTIITRPIVFIF